MDRPVCVGCLCECSLALGIYLGIVRILQLRFYNEMLTALAVTELVYGTSFRLSLCVLYDEKYFSCTVDTLVQRVVIFIQIIGQ
jgi:hypothetical protein